jgi:hypothetical protein
LIVIGDAALRVSGVNSNRQCIQNFSAGCHRLPGFGIPPLGRLGWRPTRPYHKRKTWRVVPADAPELRGRPNLVPINDAAEACGNPSKTLGFTST